MKLALMFLMSRRRVPAAIPASQTQRFGLVVAN